MRFLNLKVNFSKQINKISHLEIQLFLRLNGAHYLWQLILLPNY